jgi:aldehyde:ferredoxin oxidoreductase
MPFGYCGKILHVDLSSGNISIEEPPESFYRRYMGGSALNLYYLLREMPAGADPLGPENILALSAGVATGTAISGQSRVTATAKSPLTGAIGDSQAGGFWPAKLKFAGFDAVIIKGKSPKPVYLWVHDGEAELRDAAHIWGKLTGEAEALIKAGLADPKLEVLQIGPAGESLVRFACLINMCNRANGRTGMGAVMGSKNLKAVAVQGSQRPGVADKPAFKELSKWGAKQFPKSMVAGLGKYGTAGVVSGQQSSGGLPTRNFNSGVFEGWEKIDGAPLYENYLKGHEQGKQDTQGRDTCHGCVVRCKRVVELKEGPVKLDPLYGGPEYETIATFGSYCGVDDIVAVSKANEICNQYGMDTISCGATIAWAMETFEAGQLSLENTSGLDLQFGNAAAMVALTESIGKREGFGNVLAEGSSHSAENLGVGAEFLITAKGQEAPAHMPQVKQSLALAYAVNPFGADHMSSEHDAGYEDSYSFFQDRLAPMGLVDPQPPRSLNSEKAHLVQKSQELYSLTDSLNLCQFVWGGSWQLYGPEQIVSLVRAVSGWDVTLDELLTAGARRVNMMRAFNVREGFDQSQDQLSDKFFNRPLEGGISDGWKVDRSQFEAAKKEYYRLCGWEEDTGHPTRSTLDHLELDWVADLLEL